MLALCAAASLSPVYVVSVQDVSRLCLTRALAQGRVEVGGCVGGAIDRARRDGRTYSDKPPGISALALPAAEAVRLLPPSRWTREGDPRVWAVRVLVGGLAYVLLALLVGRVSEGVAEGHGGGALVAFALGTLVAPLAATTFGHVTAAALAFGAFVLAWRRSSALAGLAAGAAVVVEYEAAVVLVVVGAYVAAAGLRPLARFALSALPPLILLGAYHWAAFGSPFRTSYAFVANEYAREQSRGLLGVHVPYAGGLRAVVVGDRGLLWSSPVLLVAAAGLVLLALRHRREAVVAGVVAFVFLAANSGYFLPYGGISPGPRFLVPALPFIALGLGPALARWRLPTIGLAAASVVATTTLTLTWAMAEHGYRGGVWGELARLPADRGASPLVQELAKNIVVWAGPGRLAAAAAVAAVASAALVAAVAPFRRQA